MKLVKVIGTGAIALCAGDWASAAYPPLDRPTPPPCCADGVCHAHGLTWGVYQTRWRRWPTEIVQADTTPLAPSEKLGPDLKPYEAPPAEEEDQRAPPPTKPKEEQEAEESEAPTEGPLDTTPETPRIPRPEDSLQTPTTPFPSPGRFPWEEENGGGATQPAEEGGLQTPRTAPLVPPAPMPWEKKSNEPSGDLDPPPTLPSVVTAGAVRAPSLQAPANSGPPQPPITPRPAAPTDDPPPKLPIVLASAM
jgi:hypothetical protein